MRTDAIRLTQKQQAVLRRKAVRLREKGRSSAEVAQILNVHRKTVSGWWAAYGRIGHALFEAGKRGRRVGAGRRLTATQEHDLRRLITEETPDRLELPFVLWSGSAIGELIARRFGITLPARTLREYLRRWGYTPPRPQKRARERRDRAMRTWLAQTYPAIVRGARREAAQLFWGDHHARLMRGPARMTPSMMRAVPNRGAVRFLFYSGVLSAALLVRFFERLVASTDGRKVHLILARRPLHHAEAFRRWTDDHRHEVTVHYLPSFGG